MSGVRPERVEVGVGFILCTSNEAIYEAICIYFNI